MTISKLHADKGNYKERASEDTKTGYAHDQCGVLFKPTMAEDDQFQGTFDEALTYSSGRIEPENRGFAIKGWESEGIPSNEGELLSIGN